MEETLKNIRTELRKHTVQTAIYKNQPEAGSRRTAELLAYVRFMTEEDCKEFLDSVRPAPFIPNIGLMWTKQVVEYLMLTDRACLEHTPLSEIPVGAEKYVDGRLYNDGGVPYRTKYVMQHVPKEFWHMLPEGWTANYFTPSKVLKIAVCSYHINDLCKYIAEKIFIRAADLEDCLKPVTKLPPALPMLPKPQKKVSNSVTLRGFNDGTNITVSVQEGGKPNVIRTEKPKVSEPPKQQRNPVIAATPMFSAENDGQNQPKGERSEEINAAIMARYKGFGGTDTARQIAESFGVTLDVIYSRAYALRKKNDRPPIGKQGLHLTEEKREEVLQAVKTRAIPFGGTDSYSTLAKELDVSEITIKRFVKKIHSQAEAQVSV